VTALADELDSDEHITVTELETFLKGTQYDDFLVWLMADRRKKFRCYDANHDGWLSRRELLQALEDFVLRGFNKCHPAISRWQAWARAKTFYRIICDLVWRWAAQSMRERYAPLLSRSFALWKQRPVSPAQPPAPRVQPKPVCRLNIVTPEREVLSYDVDPALETKVGELKLLQEGACGIPFVQQKLIYMLKVLPDESRLCDEGVCADSTLYLTRIVLPAPTPEGSLTRTASTLFMPAIVRASGKTVQLVIPGDYHIHVGELKHRLCKKIAVNPALYELLLDGMHLHDEQDLWELREQITDQSTFVLIEVSTSRHNTMRTSSQLSEVRVECPDGTLLLILLEGITTLGELKQHIWQTIGTPVFRQLIKYKGAEVEGNQTVLEQLGIRGGAVLQLCLPMDIQSACPGSLSGLTNLFHDIPSSYHVHYGSRPEGMRQRISVDNVADDYHCDHYCRWGRLQCYSDPDDAEHYAHHAPLQRLRAPAPAPRRAWRCAHIFNLVSMLFEGA